MKLLRDKLERKIYDYMGLSSDIKKPGFILCHPKTLFELKHEICSNTELLLPIDLNKNTYRDIPFIQSLKMEEGEFKLTF